MASAEAPDASASAPANPSTDIDADGDHDGGRHDRRLASRLTAEFVGTAFLLAAVVGSGIMAERLTDDVGLQLFQNAFATAGVLMALILTFAAASGAHFNPAVTLADWVLGGIDGATAAAYVAVQVAGGVVGVMAANVMFELDPIYWSTKDRSSANLVFAEVIATIGLLLVIHGVVRSGQPTLAAFSVRRVHRRCVLLHVVDQLRQPCGHRGPNPLRHVRWDPSGLGSSLHRRSGRGRSGRSRDHPSCLPAIRRSRAAR